MNEKQILSTPEVISGFLCQTSGNWRAGAYITCRACKYARISGCGDFLFTTDEKGSPLLLPLHDAVILFGAIDKSECLIELSNLMFRELYKPWFLQAEKLSPKDACPFQKLGI